MFKWCYNIFLISLLVSDIKKMEKSSPSIYRDVHGYVHNGVEAFRLLYNKYI